MRKVYFAGTQRVRRPGDTLRVVEPLFDDYGLTRLGDLTGLDVFGVPVYMAVRPTARTLSVSQGKGLTRLAAKVSAVMEAIEVWHAEQAVPPAVALAVPGRELGLDYAVGDLAPAVESLLTPRTVLDWVEARGAVTGTTTLVPRAAVAMNWTGNTHWSPYSLAATSNGLASGNSLAEATAHALYEVMERDSTARLTEIDPAYRHHIRLDSVDDEHCTPLLGRIRRAGGRLEIVVAPNEWNLPCFACHLWSPDTGNLLAAGAGAHTDPSVALARAITEAVQSRVTVIAGTREDIDANAFRTRHLTRRSIPRPDTRRDWHDVTRTFTARFDDDAEEMTWLAGQVAATAGTEPLVVDLSTHDAFAVVKVLCPGLRFIPAHALSPWPACTEDAGS